MVMVASEERRPKTGGRGEAAEQLPDRLLEHALPM
jgi:hypothetical protein